MAKSVRLDKIEALPGGFISVQYNYGDPPLSPATTSEVQFGDESDLRTKLQSVEGMLGEQGLLLMALAINYLNANGTFKNVTSAVGKTTNFDVFAANPLRVT